MSERILSIEAVERLAFEALRAAGTVAPAAASVARAVAAAERDGIRSHGLAYLPTFVEHVRCGKVDGAAHPALKRVRPGTVVVDANSGFAHPAIDLGFATLIPAARETGCAGLAVRNSYNCGVLGYHVEHLAEAGLLGIGFTNAPASIAPAGGRTPVLGTNPFALAVPGSAGLAFVVDQSSSVVAKSEILMRARRSEPLAEGWALDAEGAPTVDPKAALAGSMLPSGGYKGFGAALLVEVMAAALTGAVLGKDASPFSGTAGGPPRTGQFFLALEPSGFSDGVFNERIRDLAEAVQADGSARLPGSRRAEARARARAEGVAVDAALIERIEALNTA